MALHHPHMHFPSIDSTHLCALREASHLADGAVITADFQTAGKGRYDRSWISAPGDSLLLSLVLRPAIDPDDVVLLTPVLSLAILDLLADQSLAAEIRWPNDIVVGGRKLAGILAESSFAGGALEHAVVSVGINVNQDANALAAIDRPATSLFAETGVRRRPSTLLDALLAHFDALYETFLAEGFAPLFPRWRAKQILLGKRIRIEVGSEQHEGMVTAFNVDASITLLDASGRETSFHAGEVTSVSS
jgi:BirA family transcriptional regulator, biotin operon repressor / biotin---[acetyl-CoA-carboxylase] ligase